jgi:hypothetical protein
MAHNIKEILSTLQKQAFTWTLLGVSVIVFYPIVIFNWIKIKELNLLFPLGLIGISGTMVWWFWTMYIVVRLLKLRQEESMTFSEILEEVKSIRKELRKNLDKNEPL